MTALGWTFTLLSLALAIAVARLVDLQEFLKRNEAISEMENLRDFKQMVRRQMYLSLTQLLVLWGCFFFGLYDALTGQLRTTPLVVLVVLVALLYVVSRSTRRLRQAALSLPAGDKGLDGLYTAVGQIWQQKHLPDF